MTPLERLICRILRTETARARVVAVVGVVVTTLAGAVACDRADVPESSGFGPDVSSSPPPAGGYVLDPEHSFIYFAAQHMVVGTVRGRFNGMTGAAVVARDPRSSRVDVVIDAASLDTQHHARDAELRGPEFFDVTAFPTLEYHGAGFRQVEEGWIVDGVLTIRGLAREVPLELVFRGTAPPQTGTPSRIAVHATAAVKRADFGMTHGLLDEIGMVSPRADVRIEIDAEFLAEAPRSVSEKRSHQSKFIEGR